MTTTLIPDHKQSMRKKLDYCESDVIEVSLLWSRADGRIAVVVRDAHMPERFEVSVEPEHALDAFRHPFA